MKCIKRLKQEDINLLQKLKKILCMVSLDISELKNIHIYTTLTNGCAKDVRRQGFRCAI